MRIKIIDGVSMGFLLLFSVSVKTVAETAKHRQTAHFADSYAIKMQRFLFSSSSSVHKTTRIISVRLPFTLGCYQCIGWREGTSAKCEIIHACSQCSHLMQNNDTAAKPSGLIKRRCIQSDSTRFPVAELNRCKCSAKQCECNHQKSAIMHTKQIAISHSFIVRLR